MDTHALLEVSIHLCVFPTPYNIAVHHLPTDAADEPNEYNNCSVSYTDRLRLVCPNTTVGTASWGRRTKGGTVPVCLNQPICEVPHDLQYEDSGTYFCMILDAASGIDYYYVNVSVLGM